MKVVLDTNIFFSSLFSKNGASYKIIKTLIDRYKVSGQKLSVISNTLIVEIEDVLLRDENIKKFETLSKDDIESFLNIVCLVSYHQDINFLWRPFLKDSCDDMVLEVAFNSEADYIITHNIKDFKGVEENFYIKVITPQKFLKILGESL